MTPPNRFIGILAVTLIAMVAFGARSGSAQDGTPVGTRGASPAATPQGASNGLTCTGTGSNPVLQLLLRFDGPASTEDIDRTIAVLTRRAASVSPDGCAVELQADGSILVNLAATPRLEMDTAASTVSVSARLEIVDTGGAFPEAGTVIATAGSPMGGDPVATSGSTPSAGQYTAILTGADIVETFVAQSATGSFQVGITLTDDAAVRFGEYTAAHISEPLAIVLDGEVVSVPIIQSAISGGQLVIEGNDTEAEAEALAVQLRSGALPVPLTLLRSDLVTPEGQATPDEGAAGEVEGVEIFTIETAQHTTDPVAYPQSPPVGGMHDPAWQNCGFYDAPVRNEHAVHSLEHGVVWITYHPDLSPIEVDALRQLTLLNDRLLISPYPGLDAPIVLSTWDRQLRIDAVDDPRLFEFIDTYTGRAPEPRANCQGRIGTPAGTPAAG